MFSSVIPAAVAAVIIPAALLGATPEPPPPFEIKTTEPGPWGIIEYSRIILEPSDDYIAASRDLNVYAGPPTWRFVALDKAGVAAIMSEAGLPKEVVASLVESASFSYDPSTGLGELRPPSEAVIAMSPEHRSSLYPRILPPTEENPYHQPFALAPGGIHDVTQIPTGLPDETIELIDQLTYEAGDAKRFSDISILMASARDQTERYRILKVLGRESSLTTRLVVESGSDLAVLGNYWSAGGRNREILPILESVASSQGVERLDLAHLLPPLPRMLIHTYPSLQGFGIAGDMPDCFWTAFSFFSDDPPERHLDYTGHVFRERYEPTYPPFQLGDLILISDPDNGGWLHACNHIADDLVFTKNGKSMGRPWVISTLQNVVQTYLRVDAVKVAFYRLKPQYQR